MRVANMDYIQRFSLVSILLFAACVNAIPATCSSTLNPISLPWSNVTLADGIAFNRGIAVTLGGQPVSLRASTLFSNTRLRNSRNCEFGNASAQTGCQGSSGSIFNIQKSATWSTAPQGTWNVSAVDPIQSDETVIDGYDVAKFYGLPEIRGFPIEVWDDLQSDNKSGLALGPNSSLIDSLWANALIPSRSFGLFFGSRSQTKGVDGNLTLGGFDRARVAGPWYNFTTQEHFNDARCPLQVLVKDIRLNNERGSFSLFADSGSSVVACIDPLQNQFTFTQTMYNIFASLTQHPTDPTIEGGDNFTEQTFPLSAGPSLGNLTVELANGYKTEIPRYEFVSQQRGPDIEGKYSVANASRLMVAAGTSGTSSLDGVQVPILGGVYLSQNYLLVDHERGTFKLAPAVLGKLGDDAHHIVKFCDGMEIELSETSSSTKSSTSNVGAIAGGVVGGLVAVALACLLFWYISRRRNRTSSRGCSTTQPNVREINASNGTDGNDAPQLYRNGYAQDQLHPSAVDNSHRGAIQLP